MNIRNFCIIAHIDHGKSTLADRLIEITGTKEQREMKAQLLDTMDLERERGITIKLQPVRMNHIVDGQEYQFNLIDTPGHTDFRYEVSRSLAACEGVILLVDASQGIQAQTLAVLYMAMEHDLEIIPVLNKIDLPAAEPQRVGKEVSTLIGCDPDSILHISAKTGLGVPELLDSLAVKVPPPKVAEGQDTKALIFDAFMDPYRGAVAYTRVIKGEFKKGDKINLLGSKAQLEIQDVGFFAPSYVSDTSLNEGEIGYIITGAKEVSMIRTGDTIALKPDIEPLPGYKAVQPMIFAGLYPTEADGYPDLRDAIEKLSMNDAALVTEPEQNSALGNGFRVGFLGLLHMDIVQERLEREHGCDVIITAPSVLYEIELNHSQPAEIVRSSMLKPDEPKVARISNPSDWPDLTYVNEIREPWVKLEIVSRNEDVGAVMKLVQSRRGVHQNMEYLDANRVVLHYEAPLQSIVTDFFDQLKSSTAGYASMSYEPIGLRPGDMVKLSILLLGEPADALSSIIHRSEAHSVGMIVCKKLKEVLPRAQYVIPIQAAIGGKVVARETLSAFRKDVTAGLYGGDVSRKNKLRDKQKKGKKRMRQVGKVTLTQDAFLSVLQRD
jgi:GTP-binding protein LepA